MTSERKLDLSALRDAMKSGAAIRSVTRLQPAGGPGDKVFPPTFGDIDKIDLPNGQSWSTKYAVERRRLGGDSRLCVLLDSVASQANRMEEALQRSWDEERVKFPVVRVDFTGATHDDPALDLSTLGGDGYLTALETPHRLADALLRDSMLGELRFRASKDGREFTEAAPHNATAVYRLCPTALIFGMWDSTGPKGGQGAKFQRALVSEIVGVGVEFGRKTASRIDPVGVEINAGPIFAAEDPEQEWTLDESEARKDKKGNPVPFSRKGKEKPGRPSNINHGNIAPSLDSIAGGVTLDYAQQTTVLSLPALRRLRFPRDAAGKAVARGERRRDVEHHAHVALATLALAGVVLQRENGFDLRSRCAFVPEGGAFGLEVIDRDGNISGPLSLSPEDAVSLVAEASVAAEEVGMGWSADPIDLRPAPKLVALIRKSREVAAVAVGEDEER